MSGPASSILRLNRALLLLIVLLGATPLPAQESNTGVAVPVTVTAEAVATHRLQTFVPTDAAVAAAFRAMFYPTARMGAHWFAYSAVQVHSAPFFNYETFYPDRGVDADLLQSFVEYTNSAGKHSFSLKAGEMYSAFGSFQQHYDDAANALLGAPLSYGSYTGLRSDQLPCGVPDLQHQIYFSFVQFSCGGSTAHNYGMIPDSLYHGVTGAEFDFTRSRLDARFQLTNSSPSNPQPLNSTSQHIQWAGGGGFTIVNGFRLGFSFFRGPFLDKSVQPFLPAGKSVADYPAQGEGIDVQFAKGRWSAAGEWQWFQYPYPGFRNEPALDSAYAELKSILTPRFYGAYRISYQGYNNPADSSITSSQPFQPSVYSHEFAIGIHLNHLQTVKVGYELRQGPLFRDSRQDVLAVQLVTSINSISKVLR